MQNQGGKEQAQELSPVETPAQAVVSGLADVGRAASPASDKAHKKHTKKRPKSADVFRNGSKSPEGGAESPPARSNKPKRESKAKKSDATSGPPPSSRPSSPLELSQAPLASVGKGAAPAEALPAAPPPGAPEAPKPADLTTHPPARDVPALRGFDNTLAAADQGKPKIAILPMIGSVVIICLMLVVVISMLVSSRRRARAAGTDAAKPTAVFGDDGEVTATSATTNNVTMPNVTMTGTTGTENTTSSHSRGLVVE